MLRFLRLALLKAAIITAGGNLVYVLYGFLSDNPYKISLAVEIVFFLVTFLVSLIEYLWKNRKK